MASAEETLRRDVAGREQFNTWFREEYERLQREQEAAHTPSMAIIATKGMPDWACPPIILSTTAAALGWNVSIFFSFYGLELHRRELDLKVFPLGNPAMPMKMPIACWSALNLPRVLHQESTHLGGPDFSGRERSGTPRIAREPDLEQRLIELSGLFAVNPAATAGHNT